MDIKEKSKQELISKIEKLEDRIHKNGLGSGYLERAEKIQRNINLGLFAGGVALLGAATWAILRAGQEES